MSHKESRQQGTCKLSRGRHTYPATRFLSGPEDLLPVYRGERGKGVCMCVSNVVAVVKSNKKIRYGRLSIHKLSVVTVVFTYDFNKGNNVHV